MKITRGNKLIPHEYVARRKVKVTEPIRKEYQIRRQDWDHLTESITALPTDLSKESAWKTLAFTFLGTSIPAFLSLVAAHILSTPWPQILTTIYWVVGVASTAISGIVSSMIT